MPPRPSDPWRTVGALSSVGLSLVLAIVIGTGAGWWVDERFGVSPWGFFAGFLLGLAAGILTVYRTTGRYWK